MSFDQSQMTNAELNVLLNRIEGFLSRFVSYPSRHALTAHVLWIAHTHAIEAFESTPRLAFLSPEPGSGKSRALEITQLLVPNPVEAINVTPAYLFRKVGSKEGKPTILYDEIDTVFGPKAKDNEEIRGLLNAGHRKHSVAGRCVVRGKTVETEEIPAYCAVALAGLGKIPETILSRSIVIKMRRRARKEQILPFRRRLHAEEGNALRNELSTLMLSAMESLADAWPTMPPEVIDRDADVWEALLAISDLAGSEWSHRARMAAVFLVSDSKQDTPSLGIQLLRDLKDIFDSTDRLQTETILRRLNSLSEAPWADLRGRPIDARTLSRILAEYEIKSKVIRFEDATYKGYLKCDFLDVWERYLSPPPPKCETEETSKTIVTESSSVRDVTHVLHVFNSSEFAQKAFKRSGQVS